MSAIQRVTLTVLAAALGFAQTPQRPEFEVASIRPSAQTPQDQVSVGLHIDGSQSRFTFLSLKDYIAMAYRVKSNQISGPDWIASQRFDISATMPSGGGATAKIPEMMQALLEDRFQLKLHRDKKDFSVYALEVAKGGMKMKESPLDSDTGNGDAKGGLNIAAGGSAQGVAVNLGRGSYYTFSNGHFEAKKLSMESLAGMLERFLNRTVVEMTELKGNYDFAFDVTTEDYRAMLIQSAIAAGVVLPPEALRAIDAGSMASLFDGLQKLGLKLDSRKAPLEILVIDQSLKSPTDN